MGKVFWSASDRPRDRVPGLDALRFVLASWVVFGHFGIFPLFQGIDQSWTVGFAIHGVFNNIASGPAAVIVFFVISGFCIHYPYRRTGIPDVVAFYSRRNIRIVLPALAAVLLARPLGIRLTIFQDSILWSLVCEEIYYLLYPLLARCFRMLPLGRLIVLAYLAAYAVVLTNPRAGDYPSYGVWLNWVLGLPCWLLGCQLAERLDPRSELPVPERSLHIWSWRVGALGCATLCSALRFHSVLTYPWTLDVFALYAYLWLGREIAWARSRGPSWLERGGAFSYSIYLFHIHAQSIFQRLRIPTLGADGDWILSTGFIIGLCYVFYLLVERPSHRLARLVHVRVTAWRSPLEARAARSPIDGVTDDKPDVEGPVEESGRLPV